MGRLAQVTIASALLAIALWVLLTAGLAQLWQERDPARALYWQPRNAEALLRINETETSYATKARRARAVLLQRPLDGRAYRQLAQTEESSGRIASARRLYAIANRRDPRDRLALAWLADDALAHGAAAGAMARADRLLRMDPFLLKPGYEVLAKLTASESFRRELSTVLSAGAPPWRSEFLATWAAANSTPDAALDATFSELARSHTGLAPWERDAWAERLLREQRWNAAWTTWARTLAIRARPGQVFNGSFESEPHGVFDWVLGSPAGASIDRADGGAGSALRVEFYDQRVGFDDVSQLLLLAPGRYRFDARVRLDELRSDGSLVWTLGCESPQRASLGSGAPLRGTSPWHEYSFEFTVPASCPAQRLALQLQARVASEKQIAGVAFLDDVRVTPVSAAAARLPDSLTPSVVPAPTADDIRATLEASPFVNLVRANVGLNPNEAGNRDADVPVGP